jgi:hypothetical protein
MPYPLIFQGLLIMHTPQLTNVLGSHDEPYPPSMIEGCSCGIFFQWYGCLCAFQYSSASINAWASSSNVSKRRHFNANERNCFHHGSIKLSQQEYLGINCICISGYANRAVWTSRLLCILRLSSIINHRSDGKRVIICSRSWICVAPSREGLNNNVPSPVLGSNAPCNHILPRLP